MIFAMPVARNMIPATMVSDIIPASGLPRIEMPSQMKASARIRPQMRAPQPSVGKTPTSCSAPAMMKTQAASVVAASVAAKGLKSAKMPPRTVMIPISSQSTQLVIGRLPCPGAGPAHAGRTVPRDDGLFPRVDSVNMAFRRSRSFLSGAVVAMCGRTRRCRCRCRRVPPPRRGGRGEAGRPPGRWSRWWPCRRSSPEAGRARGAGGGAPALRREPGAGGRRGVAGVPARSSRVAVHLIGPLQTNKRGRRWSCSRRSIQSTA